MTSYAEFPVANENESALQKRKLPPDWYVLVCLLIHILYSTIGGSPLQCWDNSTRGLDSATALDFVRTLRTSTEVTGATAVVAIYQASQSIYDVSPTI